MIFVTGDTHGDFSRFSSKNFPAGRLLTRDDVVVICGDFGGVWAPFETASEKWTLDWLAQKPYTIAFVDGNHENFTRLSTMPVSEWKGGCIHRVRENVLHLMRGEIYNIEGKVFFCFGGAQSHDIQDGILEPGDPRIRLWKKDFSKCFRINGVSWWKEELPTREEMDHGFQTLQGYKRRGVDFVITHSPPTGLLQKRSPCYKADTLTEFLQNIADTCPYGYWYFGHMHNDLDYPEERASCVYRNLFRIV